MKLVISEQEGGVQYVRVGQDSRLNNRVIDLRTPANQAIFRIQCQVSSVRTSCTDYTIFTSHTCL